MSVLGDPVRPGDFYAFLIDGVNSGKANIVTKSTDFGATWSTVYNNPAMSGNSWGNAIDPNPNRDPATPPTMYSCAGYGSQGLFKSTDGGRTWVQLLAKPTIFDPYNPFGMTADVYSVTILPDNPPNHIVITFHGGWPWKDAGLGESTDGGATWVAHVPPANFGESQYLLAVDKDTWIIEGQWTSNTAGIWRTTTAGRVNGVPSAAAWNQVSTVEHNHGQWQGYADPQSRAVYTTGTGDGTHGIFRSTDAGATWSSVAKVNATTLIGTGEYIYSSFGSTNANLLRSKRSDGGNWTSYCTTPSGLTSLGANPNTMASSFNGTNWVILGAANDSGGMWRYVESPTAIRTRELAGASSPAQAMLSRSIRGFTVNGRRRQGRQAWPRQPNPVPSGDQR